jgi:hypothetical protein
MKQCFICDKSADDTVIFTIVVKNHDRMSACVDHLRQAISQSDIAPITEQEWRKLARRLLDEYEDKLGGKEPQAWGIP